jgi:hypothetical protein
MKRCSHTFAEDSEPGILEAINNEYKKGYDVKDANILYKFLVEHLPGETWMSFLDKLKEEKEI